jgi:hypothetical protein
MMCFGEDQLSLFVYWASTASFLRELCAVVPHAIGALAAVGWRAGQPTAEIRPP